MKICTLTLLLLTFELFAATVDTNQSATLVRADTTSNLTQNEAAFYSVLSKKSGLGGQALQAQFPLTEQHQQAVLRSYVESVPPAVDASAQWFHLIVDDEKTHQYMLDNDIPVWPDRRGQLFVWVVEELADQTLVSSVPESPVVYWLKKWFDVTGIPVQFYDPNAADLLVFQPEDVRFLNPDLVDFILIDEIHAAVLLVFVQHTRSGYSYRFGLAQPEQPMLIKNRQFVDLAGGMQALVTAVQAVMAEGQRLYADEFNTNTIGVSINDLVDADHMLRLISYLDNHALVDAYQINQFQDQQLQAVMRIKVLPDTFIDYVNKEGLLAHVPLDLGQTILFKWLP
ncbi:DUF2066 domain-containing protein [Marinicella meishanensis]|uniref:DUF2066 domain-containing protein n=1 Tax=Marinicella meishanensis TaxID=2873263 RepID=UPI001CBEF99D|nr:DUF2066 domain-containing protein [Marinicella sp. NBU2979]